MRNSNKVCAYCGKIIAKAHHEKKCGICNLTVHGECLEEHVHSDTCNHEIAKFHRESTDHDVQDASKRDNTNYLASSYGVVITDGQKRAARQLQ